MTQGTAVNEGRCPCRGCISRTEEESFIWWGVLAAPDRLRSSQSAAAPAATLVFVRQGVHDPLKLRVQTENGKRFLRNSAPGASACDLPDVTCRLRDALRKVRSGYGPQVSASNRHVAKEIGAWLPEVYNEVYNADWVNGVFDAESQAEMAKLSTPKRTATRSLSAGMLETVPGLRYMLLNAASSSDQPRAVQTTDVQSALQLEVKVSPAFTPFPSFDLADQTAESVFELVSFWSAAVSLAFYQRNL